MGLKIPKQYLVFDGKASTDFGVWISGGGTFNAPGRDFETVSVPGRNGDLTLDNGRYKNVQVTYPAFISSDFSARIEAFRSWICSKTGYKRLEDTYHPDEYRLGIYQGGLSVKTAPRNIAGSFDITFNCKPQRYLKSGEHAVSFTASGEIYNPTEYTALPLLRVYGTGSFTIGGITIEVNSTTTAGYIDIDCELMDAYKGTTNCNGYITLTDGEFPKLDPGTVTVTLTSVTKVEITPRWWRL